MERGGVLFRREYIGFLVTSVLCIATSADGRGRWKGSFITEQLPTMHHPIMPNSIMLPVRPSSVKPGMSVCLMAINKAFSTLELFSIVIVLPPLPSIATHFFAIPLFPKCYFP